MSKQQTRVNIEDIAIEGTELRDEHLRLVSGGLRNASKVIVITQGGDDGMEYPDAGF